MATFKVLLGEKDGVEFEEGVEYDLLQALTELGILAPTRNFSQHLVLADETLNIPVNQHMICTHLEVEGFLTADGGIVFL